MKNVFLALSNPTSEEAAACDSDMWQVWSAATVLSVKCCRIRRKKIQNTPTVWKLKQCQINCHHWQTSARNHHDHRVQPPSVPKHSHTHACTHIRTHTEGRQGGERQERVPAWKPSIIQRERSHYPALYRNWLPWLWSKLHCQRNYFTSKRKGEVRRRDFHCLSS